MIRVSSPSIIPATLGFRAGFSALSAFPVDARREHQTLCRSLRVSFRFPKLRPHERRRSKSASHSIRVSSAFGLVHSIASCSRDKGKLKRN